MITMLFVFALCLLGVAALFVAARGHALSVADIQELPLRTQPVDLAAFRNLMSARDERFLRENLPAREYRRVQRIRLRAAREYVLRLTDNAAVLIRLGEASRHSPDEAVARAAQQLVGNAVTVRLLALAVQAELWSRVLVPGSGLSVASLIRRYETVTERVTLLGRLQAPATVTQISAAL